MFKIADCGKIMMLKINIIATSAENHYTIYVNKLLNLNYHFGIKMFLIIIEVENTQSSMHIMLQK